MRRICTLLLVLVLIFCGEAFAHPGRTDSRGGHTDHATGEYHYHHGHPAHQHPDGECPYLSKSTPTATPRPKSAPTASPAPESTAFLRTRSSASTASAKGSKHMSWKQLGDALLGTILAGLTVLFVAAEQTIIACIAFSAVAFALGFVLAAIEKIFKIRLGERTSARFVFVPAGIVGIVFLIYLVYGTVGPQIISRLQQLWNP